MNRPNCPRLRARGVELPPSPLPYPPPGHEVKTYHFLIEIDKKLDGLWPSVWGDTQMQSSFQKGHGYRGGGGSVLEAWPRQLASESDPSKGSPRGRGTGVRGLAPTISIRATIFRISFLADMDVEFLYRVAPRGIPRSELLLVSLGHKVIQVPPVRVRRTPLPGRLWIELSFQGVA